VGDKDILGKNIIGKLVNGKRAVGYFRVSSEEQVEGYSIAAQERAYRQYVEAHNYISIAEYLDEGLSARTDNIRRRPQFTQMLHDAQVGLFDVIIVHKMDRFSRSLKVAVQAFELLGKCNVGLASVSKPNLDYSTPQGKLFMHMLWALAQFYSDNLSQETKKGKQECRQQGLHNGTLPLGTLKKNGIAVPDKRDLGLGENRTNYDGLLLIFQRAADGVICKTIAEELNSLGYRTTGNQGANLFTKDTITGILRNRFYLGELPDGEYGEGRSHRGVYTKGLKGKHQSLIPIELWEAAQKGKASNSTLTGRPVTALKANVYSLSGLLQCGYCGGKLHIHSGTTGKLRVYCYARSQGIAPDCKQRSTFLSIYENQLEQYLDSVKLPENYQQVILEAYKREDEEGPGFNKQRQDLENRLKCIKSLFEWGDISAEDYQIQRNHIQAEQAVLPSPTNSKKKC
jgi:DNA invertase Pin-like site-specific DNA recombinase